MKILRTIAISLVLLFTCDLCLRGDADLTIYNQNFAVVRSTVPLDLKKGLTEIHLTDMTSNLEPDSVILRDPTGKHAFQIVEQSYRADPVSQGLLLALNEGKTIQFLVNDAGKMELVEGKVIRSGYVRASTNYIRTQYGVQTVGNTQPGDPIIEMDGKLRFGLPGTPLFPSISDQAVLKPTLSWTISSESSAHVDAELSYVTGGLNWEAAYNIVAPETGDLIDLVGWVTMRNQTGKEFNNAHIKLMAGDVNKVQMGPNGSNDVMEFAVGRGMAGPIGPAVTQKQFDEYHLYELHQPVKLHDKETKQVEFTRASGVQSNRYYVYDGMKIDPQYQYWNVEMIRQQSSYGTQSNLSVWVMREFPNTTENHLGIPLPAGRIRFYRRDTDGHLEFTGENTIEHTPEDETVQVYTGTAFDLVGERKQTGYHIQNNGATGTIDESFEIKLRNHTKGPVEIRIQEHMYRGLNWSITQHSDEFKQTDSRSAEFRVKVDPAGEKTLTYTVHYSW